MLGLERFWHTAIESDQDDAPEDGPAIDWSRVHLGRSEFERRRERLQRHALEDEPASNVIALRLAPPRVSWTTEPPTQPGLYFVKLAGGSTRVVDVYADHRGRLQASWSDIDEFPVTRPGMFWSNHSIQEPE